MGYKNRDFEIVDYQTYNLGKSKIFLRGPKPNKLEKKSYFSCVGSAHTFGCYADNPYPKLLESSVSIPSLNLGLGGAIPETFYVHKKELMNYINDSKFAIIQIVTARTVSNSLLEGLGYGETVIDKKTGIKTTADRAYEELISQLSHEELHEIVEETRANYIETYKIFLEQVKVPKILLWFSTRKPYYEDKYEGIKHCWQLFKDFPQLVNQSMVEELKKYCDDYVEHISKRGLPQLLVSRFTGEAVKIVEFNGKQKTHNNYYPSPEMHLDVAQKLSPICKKYILNSKEQKKAQVVNLSARENMKKTSEKNIVIISSPRSGTTFLSNLINSLDEFEFFGEVYHQKNVLCPFKRKLEIIEYISEKFEFNIQISKQDDSELVKFAHEYPDAFLESMIDTTSNKYFGFKIFIHHLNLEQLKNTIINNENLIKLIVKRNPLEAYASEQISLKVNQWHSIKTSNVKLFFDEQHFSTWLKKIETYYSFLEQSALNSKVNFHTLSYENISNRETEEEKVGLVLDFLEKIEFKISKNVDITQLNLLKKQDNRSNILDKFENPDRVLEFLDKENLNHIA